MTACALTERHRHGRREHIHVPEALTGILARAAAVVALGLPVADTLIGLPISLVILEITWDSWRTVRHAENHGHEYPRPT